MICFFFYNKNIGKECMKIMSLKNKISWDRCLGIGVEKTPKGQRTPEWGNGVYTELALKYENWLRDEKGFPENEMIEYDLNSELRKEFFLNHVNTNPEWFSTSELQTYTDFDGNKRYSCTKCRELIDGTILHTHKH